MTAPKRLRGWFVSTIVLGAATVGWAPADSGPEEARSPKRAGEPASEMACTFNLRARNSSSVNVYLHLYTSTVRNWANLVAGYRALKIQNHRVAPGASMSRTYSASGKCRATRNWKLYYRRGSNGSQRTKSFSTYRTTRVNSNGQRVLDLGDVGKW